MKFSITSITMNRMNQQQLLIVKTGNGLFRLCS